MPKYKIEGKQLYAVRLVDPILKLSHYAAWCEDPDRLVRLVKYNHEGDSDDIKNLDNIDGCCYAVKAPGGYVPFLAFPFKWENTHSQIKLVSHECIHSVCLAFRERRISLPTDFKTDEELFCRYHDWLFEAVLDAMENQDDNKFCFNSEKLIK